MLFHLLYILPPYFCRSIYYTSSLRISAVPSTVHPPSVFLPFHLLYILPPYFCRSIYCTSSLRISAVPSIVHPPSVFLPFHLLYILPPYFCRSIYCTSSLRISAVPSIVHPPFTSSHTFLFIPDYLFSAFIPPPTFVTRRPVYSSTNFTSQGSVLLPNSQTLLWNK